MLSSLANQIKGVTKGDGLKFGTGKGELGEIFVIVIVVHKDSCA